MRDRRPSWTGGPGAALLAALLGLLWAAPARAQLEVETVRKELDLTRLKVRPDRLKKITLDSFKARYRYQVAGFRRLLPLEGHIRRCVDAQRRVSGEFHDRLDFVIEQSGALKSFAARRSKDQLQACLLPHVMPLRFPAHEGKRKTYTLQVLVGSPAMRLGRRVRARAVAIYPLGTREEQRTYRRAVSWVLTPWSMAMSRCAEWVDQSMGYGYRVRMTTAINPAGRAVKTAVQLKGKLAREALRRLVGCVAPFLKGMRAPKHKGPGNFTYKHGSTTAGWGIR